MAKLLQIWEEIIGNFRNITCCSSCVSQVCRRGLSIPGSKFEHKTLCPNLFCWQFCDKDNMTWSILLLQIWEGNSLSPHGFVVRITDATLILCGEMDEEGGCKGLMVFAVPLTVTVMSRSSAAHSVSLSAPHTIVQDLYSCCMSCSLTSLSWRVRPDSWKWRGGRWWQFWAHF